MHGIWLLWLWGTFAISNCGQVSSVDITGTLHNVGVLEFAAVMHVVDVSWPSRALILLAAILSQLARSARKFGALLPVNGPQSLKPLNCASILRACVMSISSVLPSLFLVSLQLSISQCGDQHPFPIRFLSSLHPLSKDMIEELCVFCRYFGTLTWSSNTLTGSRRRPHQPRSNKKTYLNKHWVHCAQDKSQA